jgi:flagellar hook-basal body complex protein FliE
MALNQKYTWADFLKEHPDLKKKGVKRTSPEGKKAFESAYKTKIKAYLSSRVETVNKLKKMATEKRKTLTEKVAAFQKAEDNLSAGSYQEKVGAQDAWLGRLERQASRIKVLQKGI